jgi:hypothetical protein
VRKYNGILVVTGTAAATILCAAGVSALEVSVIAKPAPAGVLSVAGPNGVPQLAAIGYGWFEEGDDFLPPASGPGPIFSDPKHPYHSNQSGVQPTYRVADISNPILQPWVRQALQKANDRALKGAVPYNPRERCWPAGVPGFTVYTRVRPVYFIQGAREVLIINEGDAQVRHVYLNVRHSSRVEPSWYGESIGHYEGGDTLVVDTIGISEKTFVDNYLTPHTDKLHVIERYTLARDGRSLNVTVDVDDSGAFTTKWSARQIYHLGFQGPWDESPCADNNTNYFGLEFSPIPEAKTPDF